MANGFDKRLPGEYYVLRNNNHGKRVEEKKFYSKFLSSSNESYTFVATKGMLFSKAPEKQQPNNLDMIGLIAIKSQEKEIWSLDVVKEDVWPINEKEFNLLRTLNSDEERYSIMNDSRDLLEKACRAEKGYIVLKYPFGEYDTYGTIMEINEYKCGLMFDVCFQMNHRYDRSKWIPLSFNQILFLQEPDNNIYEMKNYYILCDNVEGTISYKGDTVGLFNGESGSLVYEMESTLQPISKNEVCVSIFNLKDLLIYTDHQNLIKIDQEDAGFLVTLSNQGRLDSLRNRDQLELAKKARNGDMVRVGELDGQISDITFKNGGEFVGRYFYILIMDSKFSEEIVKVVNFTQVQFLVDGENTVDEERDLKEWVKDGSKRGSRNKRKDKTRQSSKSNKEEVKRENYIGHRCLILDREIHGTVRFYDKLKKDEIIYVGIETDIQLKNYDGNYVDGKKIFDCEPYHGIIVPINGVLIDCTYQQNNVPKNLNESKKKNFKDKEEGSPHVSLSDSKLNDSWENFGKNHAAQSIDDEMKNKNMDSLSIIQIHDSKEDTSMREQHRFLDEKIASCKYSLLNNENKCLRALSKGGYYRNTDNKDVINSRPDDNDSRCNYNLSTVTSSISKKRSDKFTYTTAAHSSQKGKESDIHNGSNYSTLTDDKLLNTDGDKYLSQKMEKYGVEDVVLKDRSFDQQALNHDILTSDNVWKNITDTYDYRKLSTLPSGNLEKYGVEDDIVLKERSSNQQALNHEILTSDNVWKNITDTYDYKKISSRPSGKLEKYGVEDGIVLKERSFDQQALNHDILTSDNVWKNITDTDDYKKISSRPSGNLIDPKIPKTGLGINDDPSLEHHTSFHDEQFDDHDLYGNINDEQKKDIHNNELIENINSTLTVGSMAQFRFDNETPRYGLIKWIGTVDERSTVLAGLELDEDLEYATTGTFGGKKYFDCLPKRGFFCKLSILKPDSRFLSILDDKKEMEPELKFYSGQYKPINDPKNIIGRDRGIQGDVNSCYMDATLFAMFACSDVFDRTIYRDETIHDLKEFEMIQKILREQIVNVLRWDNKVERNSVYQLRKKLEKFDNAGGGYLNREKDPEELFNLLFDKLLKMEPLMKVRLNVDGSTLSSHLWQIFVTKEEGNPLPSTQYLLECSLLPLGLLEQCPNAMIMQLPRHGKEKVFKRVHVNSTINLTPILLNKPHYCIICNSPASIHCPDCSGLFGCEKVFFYYCELCEKNVHRHPDRMGHNWKTLPHFSSLHKQEEERMELFAVTCIETSHYVSYVKCGMGEEAAWLYFDSMADRCGFENGYNIPQVMEIKDLQNYLNADVADIALLERDVKRPDDVTRIFEDASLCFYRRMDSCFESRIRII